MSTYLAGRVASLLLGLIVASIVIFSILEVLPGDPAQFILGMNAQPDTLAALRAQLGLDGPVVARYFGWLFGMLHGDFGISYTYRVPVSELILQRLGVSLPARLSIVGFDGISLSALVTPALTTVRIPRALAEWIGAFNLSHWHLLMALTLFYIILGCFLDGISMVVLTIAVLLPTVQAAGFDLIWFGIFIVLVVEMAQITPPVGFNLFVLQGLTQREVTWIARTALPLFFLMIVAVLITWFAPDVVLWLPRRMQG